MTECPQLKIVRIDGSLYFGAVNHVRSGLDKLAMENPDQKNLLIVGSGINFIDMVGAELLAHLAIEPIAAAGALYFL